MEKQTITEQEFTEYIADRFSRFFSLCQFCKKGRAEFNQRFLGMINLESTQAEEILDLYGSMRNAVWFGIREVVSGIKNFSQIGYNLLHINYALPRYALATEVNSFSEKTKDNIDIIRTVFRTLCLDLVSSTEKLNIPVKEHEFDLWVTKPTGNLPETRKRKHIHDPGVTIVHLATAFLNLTEDDEILNLHETSDGEHYRKYFDGPLNEGRVRQMENTVHSLQATYDTTLADTDIEDKDKDLRLLRGHISIIYHLLEVSTLLTHFYERHMMNDRYCPIDPQIIRSMVVDYTLYFSSQFLQAAKDLCRSMIKQYGKQGEITVNVPQYRGFHVRPSTLIAKIVRHYAGEVEAELSGQTFDASSPMELFRANEHINAYKRNKLYEEIDTITDRKDCLDLTDTQAKEEAHRIFFQLLRKDRIMIFNNNFAFDDVELQKNESLCEFIKRGVARSMAMGNMDIPTDMKIRFKGDKRVLADLKVLAEHGYGEDKFGNNIMLPKELSYLKR